MRDKNPDYVTGPRGNIATKCRICGGQLTHPTDIKNEIHSHCLSRYKSKLR